MLFSFLVVQYTTTLICRKWYDCPPSTEWNSCMVMVEGTNLAEMEKKW